MKVVRCLVLCSTRFGIPAIQLLHHYGMLTAVCVPEGGDEIADHAASVLAKSKLPIIRIPRAESDATVASAIKEYEINLALMLTWPYKISAAVFTLPTEGFYNLHTGPLPRYRGPDPIFWQIKNRETTAGISLHRIDEGFDTGPVIIKKSIPLDAATTYGLLTTQLAEKAVDMIGVLLKMLMMDIRPPFKLQEDSLATYYPKQTAGDVTIDWEKMEAGEIVTLAGACNPWNKGAITRLNGRVIRIPFATILDSEETGTVFAPGTITSIDESRIVIATPGATCISVPFLYFEEGFIPASEVHRLGISAGNVFTSGFNT